MQLLGDQAKIKLSLYFFYHHAGCNMIPTNSVYGTPEPSKYQTGSTQQTSPSSSIDKASDNCTRLKTLPLEIHIFFFAPC